MTNDWLPGRRAAQLELAKQWKPHVTAQKTAWSIPNAEVTRLGNAIELVDQCQADVERNPSPGNRATYGNGRFVAVGQGGRIAYWVR